MTDKPTYEEPMKKSATFKLVIAVFLFTLLPTLAYAETSGEPDGFFGLKFGVPVPSEVIVDMEDPKFESALQKLNYGEQLLAKGDWLAAIADDPSKIPKENRRALEEELSNRRFLLVVAPPEPNRHFDDYIALVTPDTGRLGAIWAYGTLDPCEPTIRALALFLLDRYPSLEPSYLTREFLHKDSDFVILRSENVEISFMCDLMTVTNNELEDEAQTELEQIFQRVLERIVEMDKSGL